MIDELYIDNRKVDIRESGVNLAFRNYVLKDVSTLQNNYSFTIKLPKTINNLSVLDGGFLPSSNLNFVRTKHLATLLRDGIEIVKDAVVYVTSIADDIEIVLSWGTANRLENIKTLKLAELQWAQEKKVLWLVNDTFAQRPVTIDQPIIVESENAPFFYLPSVPVTEVLDAIAAESGDVIDITELKAKASQFYMPILRRNTDAARQATIKAFSMYLYDYGWSESAQFNQSVMCWATGIALDSRFRFVVRDNRNIGIELMPNTPDMKVAINFRFTAKVRVPFDYDENDIYMTMQYESNVKWKPWKLESQQTDDETMIVTAYYIFDYELTMKANVPLFFYHSSWKELTAVEGDYGINGTFEISGTEEAILAEPTSNINSTNEKNFLPYRLNLPDVKAIDFLKAISLMCGCFCFEQGGKVRFESFDYMRRVNAAVDWSDRLLGGTTPNEMRFSVGDIAKRNIFEYKNAEKLPLSSGSIDISTPTLTEENTLVSSPVNALPFGYAAILLWQAEGDYGTDMKFKENKDLYIVRCKQAPQSWDAVWDMNWNDLIQSYWGTFDLLISSNVQIKEQFKIPSVELAQLDMSRPIYLKQYGCKFVIVEVVTKQNDICEVTLVKLS